MITVVKAPPFATIQDLGRDGHRAIGVPVSGAMDRDALVACNRIVGNADGAAALEWAVAGGALRFNAPLIIAIGGGAVVATLAGAPMLAWRAYEAEAGAELRVERFAHGRFLYIAVEGGIDVPLVLGSRSTLCSALLGGLGGRRLRTGDVLQGGREHATGGARERVLPDRDSSPPVPIMRGPQATLFGDDAWRAFLATEWHVGAASDRGGYRLDGVALHHSAGDASPSEPTCVGAIQVPSGGSPIVLMNDGPTVGGYPKIAVIRADAISRFAQRAVGDAVRFELDE